MSQMKFTPSGYENEPELFINHAFTKQAKPGLAAYFGRVRKGSDEVITTAFYGNDQLQDIEDRWCDKLERLSSTWPSLLDFEIDLRSKAGPLSIMKPLKDRIDDIQSYYTDVRLPSTAVSPQAIRETIREWENQSIRIRSQRKTWLEMKKSTNSGSPEFTKKLRVANSTYPCLIVPSARDVLQQELPIGDFLITAIVGWRGQEGGPTEDDVKQRVVWMFPMSVNTLELQFYQPAIEVAQHLNIVPAWVGLESVFSSITKLFDTKVASDPIICTDFTKFDQHFNQSLQDCAYDVIESLISDGSLPKSYWLNTIFPIKYNIPIALDLDKVMFGHHGMGSGSGGTNFDETVAHRALQHEAALNSKSNLNKFSMCLGDDGLLSYPGIDLDDVLDSYTSHGLEMNPDKQHVSTDDAVYLRRWYHKDYRVNGICVGVYSTARAINRLKMRERRYDTWSPEDEVLREWSIMENCRYHPMADDFFQFCLKGSRYNLGLSIPGFIDNIEKYYDKAVSEDKLNASYATSVAKVKSGIRDWWIYDKVKSLADR